MFSVNIGVVFVSPLVLKSERFGVTRWLPCLLVDWILDPQGHQQPCYGPLARYVNLRVAHAPGMPETFSPPSRVSDPDMHQGTCAMHVPWCMPGSLTSGFLWSRCRGKRSRHSRCMRNPQFYIAGKRPIDYARETSLNHPLLSAEKL